MPTLTITFGEMTPVDKYEKKESGARCPLPTQDPVLNAKNKEIAVEMANYRDPSEDGSLVSGEVCGTCASYNQTDDVLDCIGDESGALGYCQLLKFMCSSDYVCDKWATGGPITSDIEDSYNENL